MPTQVSQTGAASRRPVYSGNRRIPGLYERKLADRKTVVFEARYRRNGGKPKLVKLDASNRTDAIAELEALKTDQRRGAPVRTGSMIPSVREVATDWLTMLDGRIHHRDPAKRYSPRTVALYRQRIWTHVIPVLGDLPIDAVTTDDVRRLVERLGRTHSAATTSGVLVVVSSLMRYAVRAKLIERNPVCDLDRDDRPGVKRQTEPRYLDADEVRLLLSKLGDTFRPVASVCAYGGLRISEALGLAWGDVDFDAKTITVRRQLDDDLKLREVTKTEASATSVRMLPALEREFREHRRRQAEINLRRVARDALVFTTANGGPQSRRNALRAVKLAGNEAGLNPEGVEPIGLHDLRHSLVGLALDAGASLAQAALLARHASPKVTAQIYAGLSDKAKVEASAKLIDAGFGA
jgi:integrase